MADTEISFHSAISYYAEFSLVARKFFGFFLRMKMIEKMPFHFI